MEVVSHTIVSLTTFVLAVYVGYHVVWNVTPALHTPLMAVTNAISAIVIVGAMLAAALTETVPGKVIGVLAVALAAVNVFGASWSRAGCWRCSGRRTRSLRLRTGCQVNLHFISLDVVTLLYLVASVFFIQALRA